MMASINDKNDLDFTTSSADVKNNWITEAQQWRLPYWDCALPTAKLPTIFATASITILDPKLPKGLKIDNNPLCQYMLMTKNPISGKLQATTMGNLPGIYEMKDTSVGIVCFLYPAIADPYSGLKILPRAGTRI